MKKNTTLTTRSLLFPSLILPLLLIGVALGDETALAPPVLPVPYGQNTSAGHFAAVNGIKLYYETYGSGQPMLQIHGNGLSISALGDEDTANAYQFWLGSEMKSGPTGHKGGSRYAFANFIKALRSRQPADIAAPIEEGHISCTLVHLANASYRLGRSLNFDPVKQEVIGDAEANRLLRDADRGYRKGFRIPEHI